MLSLRFALGVIILAGVSVAVAPADPPATTRPPATNAATDEVSAPSAPAISYVAWWNRQYGHVDGPNAATFHRQAAALVPGNERARSLAQKDGHAWTEEECEVLREWAVREDVQQLFTKATKTTACYFSPQDTFDGRSLPASPVADFPHGLRGLALSRLACAKLALRHGDAQAASELAGQLLRFAEHLQQQGRPFYYFLGRQTALQVYDLMAVFLQRCDGEVERSRLYTSFSAADSAPMHPRALRNALLAEKYALFARCGEDTDGDGRLDVLSVCNDSPVPIEPPRSMEACAAYARRAVDSRIDLYSGTYRQARRALQALEDADDRPFDGLMHFAALGVYEMFLKARLARATTYLLFDVYDYRDRHGEWPASLKQAVRTEHAEFLTDPFDGQLELSIEDGRPRIRSTGLEEEEARRQRALERDRRLLPSYSSPS